jgi:hypothetical protein
MVGEIVLVWFLVDCPVARTCEKDGGGIEIGMAGGGTNDRLNHSETAASE